MRDAEIDDLNFDVPTPISYCSDGTPVIAGDVISIGTSEGAGFARKPPLRMKLGHVDGVEIAGIGCRRLPPGAASICPRPDRHRVRAKFRDAGAAWHGGLVWPARRTAP